MDNIAPKIVGVLGLSESCDVKVLREQLVEYCQDYFDQLQLGKKRKDEITD